MDKWQNPLAVKFRPPKVTNAIRGDMRACVEVLDDVTPGQRAAVYDAVMSCVLEGRDHKLLTDRIQAATEMTRNRAIAVGSWLVCRALASIDRDRQLENGIVEAKWRHSGSPCRGTSTQDAEHSAANGKAYRIKQGMFLDGLWTIPGREAGCMCIAQPVIPGWIDEL